MSSFTITDAIQLAAQRQRSGALADAEAMYRQILARESGNAEALYHFGTLLNETRRPAAAADCFRRVVASRPNWPEAHVQLGSALAEAKQFDDAVAAYRKAIELKPDFVQAHGKLGIALRHAGRLDEAVIQLQKAAELRPDWPVNHFVLGLAYRESGRLDDAIAAYTRLTKLAPRDASACRALGATRRENRQLPQAIEALNRALQLDRNDAMSYYELGLVLEEMDRIEEALIAFAHAIRVAPSLGIAHVGFGRTAVRSQPSSPEAHIGLATALRSIGKSQEGLAACERAIELRPNDAPAHALRGLLLHDLGQTDASIDALQHSLALDPSDAEVCVDLACTFQDRGQLEDAHALLLRALARRPGHAVANHNLLFLLNFLPDQTPQTILAEHRRWAAQHADGLLPPGLSHANDRSPGRRIKIGYVSPDYRQHPVGRFLLPVFRNHNRAHFEIHGYSDVATPDHLTELFRQQSDVWHETAGLSDEALAEQVRRDGIDILLDLASHAAGTRLFCFARKPAPVQVTWLAYAGTTGLRAIDYRLSDASIDPPGTDADYAERTVRLPCYFCYKPLVPSPDVTPLPAVQTGRITFACLNKFYKVNDPLLKLWAQILRRVANSRLLLFALPGAHRERALRRFAELGVDPARVEFVDRLSPYQYLAQYQRADIALDAMPFAGGTTSCDALWMGVPLVTLRGHTAVGRVGASLLKQLNLPELIAETPEEYVSIAVNLAGDLPRLSTLRAGLRQRLLASPLSNAPQFTQDLESAYRQMWAAWCSA